MVETITRREPAAEESTSAPWGTFGMVLTVLSQARLSPVGTSGDDGFT
jgi:hypothetical protein